ncbi:hypothetical protein Ocin01_02561 [Orchesella cincta]|uniref:Uncharacterized protein n=1 Tax=Orchesella cincta TaxID=48709 RepID=A0A1D2NFW0_ORCCI|nr:hypothetical protein Ocin01_02561 [Orchesella cincta]
MLLRRIHVLYVVLVKLFCFTEFPQVFGIAFDKVDRNLSNFVVQAKENNGVRITHKGHQTQENSEHSYNDLRSILNYSSTETYILSILNSSSLIAALPNDTSGNRLKRQGESRTINVDIGPGISAGAPLCYEREVSGTCRYRTAPDECFKHEWTAHATIINIGYHKITSIPEGLIVFPSGHARVRVFLKSSCCNPLVHFIAWDIFLQQNACIVDVRELQDLHPGEIVGICVGVLLFFIILIIIIALCIRRQRQKKLEKQTVIFGRSLTRSKSRSETGNNHR